MWGQLIGLLVIYIALVMAAIGLILRDGRQFDDHVSEALDLANDPSKDSL